LKFSIFLFVASSFAAPIALSNSYPLAFSPAQMLIGDTAEGDAAILTNGRIQTASRIGGQETGIQKIDLIPRQSFSDVRSSSAESEKSSGVVPTKSTGASRRKDRRTLVQRQLYDAFILYANEQNESALAIVEIVIAEFESNRKDTDKTYYCATDRTEQAALVRLAAARNRQHVEIVGGEWCFALTLKGYLLSEFNRFDEADRVFTQSVEMAPFNMGGLRKYAVWLQDKEHWQKAIDVFRIAISLNDYIPRKSRADFPARAHRGIGFGLIALGRLDEAEASYRESLKYDPDDSLVPLELDYIEMLRENRVPIDHMRAVER
jgi:tetratricopeptide (TPR) repeat protein